MKKNELRKIIRKSIKEFLDNSQMEQPLGEKETGGGRDELPTDTDGCQCCRDKFLATGSFGGCCKWCKGGKVAAPTMDMSERGKSRINPTIDISQIRGNASKSCPCCKTGYEFECCQGCFNDGLLPESTSMHQ